MQTVTMLDEGIEVVAGSKDYAACGAPPHLRRGARKGKGIVEQQSRSWDPSYERKAVTLLAIGFGLVGLDRWIIAPLFPVMAEDLGLSYGALGLITGVLALSWGIFSFISGSVSDRIGRLKVLVPAIIAFSLLADNFGIENMLYVALFGLLVGLAISFFLEETAPIKTGKDDKKEPMPSSL